MPADRPVKVANCSAADGDRRGAALEMVEGGSIDVLTGLWSGEPGSSQYLAAVARPGRVSDSFMAELQDVLDVCAERGIRIVVRLDAHDVVPTASAVQALAARLRRRVRIAFVETDDVLRALAARCADGAAPVERTSGTRFDEISDPIMAASVPLGGWGIAAALGDGADVVIASGVVGEALTVGAAAWWHQWRGEDWDALAGAFVAGRMINGGTLLNGTRFSGFATLVDDGHSLLRPPFPWAEIAADGSSRVSTHAGGGAALSVGTATAVMLSRVDDVRSGCADVTVRLDTVRLAAAAGGAVRVFGVRGEPPPATVRAEVMCDAGFSTTASFALTGLQIARKAELVEDRLWSCFPEGAATFERADVWTARTDQVDPPTIETGAASFNVTVAARQRSLVDDDFATACRQAAASSAPGVHLSALRGPHPRAALWTAALPTNAINQLVSLGAEIIAVGATVVPLERSSGDGSSVTASSVATPVVMTFDGDETAVAPLGEIADACSGADFADAHFALFAHSLPGYLWLADQLGVERLRELFPAECGSRHIDRVELPNVSALAFTIRGLAADRRATGRPDPEAAGLGEYVRSRHMEIPVRLLP